MTGSLFARSVSRATVRWRIGGLAFATLIATAAASAGSGCATSQAPPALQGASGTSGSSSGSASGSTSGSAAGSGDGGVPTPPPNALGIAIFTDSCTAGKVSVDWAPMRRISRVEYDNMVRDLLGDTSRPSVTFQIPTEASLGYGINLPLVNTYAPADATAVTQYLLAAETIAESAVADANRMNNVIVAGIPSCAKAHDDTCASDFIATWVNRAYRGQLDATESASLLTMFQAVEAQVDWTTGMQALITAVLESPRFLYVFELGSGSPIGSVVPLSSYEVAARLAFFLWRSVPDKKVMADAAAGTLATAAGVAAEAHYMLTAKNPITGQPSAQDAIDDFTNQWLQLTGVQAKDAQYTAYNQQPDLGAQMYDEARLDVSQRVLAANGTLTDLLTSTSSYVTPDLAVFYMGNASVGAGPTAPGPSTNMTFTQMPLPNRPGVLTNGGVQATQSHATLPSLVLRGKLVRENLLCDPIGAPPPNIPGPATSAPDGGVTTRDLLMAHMQKGTACPLCHQLMDPIGVAFDNFDATGQFQLSDANGFSNGSYPPVDSSGQFNPLLPPLGTADPGALASSFRTVADFTTQLASSAQGQECFALQELRYAIGRLETVDDACSAQQVFRAFSAGNLNIQTLLLAVATSDAMRYRSVETTGSACQ